MHACVSMNMNMLLCAHRAHPLLSIARFFYPLLLCLKQAVVCDRAMMLPAKGQTRFHLIYLALNAP